MDSQNYLIGCVGSIVVAVLVTSLAMKATEREWTAIVCGALTFVACMIAWKLNGWA